MIPPRRLSLAALLALAAIPSGRALDWDRRQISAAPERGADVVRAKFEFKNSSKKLVHVLGVTTYCGCTEATPSSSNIAPGERGSLDILFTIGKNTGVREEDITVLADDSAIPTELKLTVTIPGPTVATPPKKP